MDDFILYEFTGSDDVTHAKTRLGPIIHYADAAEVSPGDFLRSITGKPAPDRQAEAAFIESMNAAWKAAKAQVDALQQAEGESLFDFTRRKMLMLNAHDKWEQEQRDAWANGTWKAPAVARRAA